MFSRHAATRKDSVSIVVLAHTTHSPHPHLTRTGWSSSSGRPSSFAIPFNGQCFRQAKHAGRMWLLCYSPSLCWVRAGRVCVPSTYSVCQLLCWMERKGNHVTAGLTQGREKPEHITPSKKKRRVDGQTGRQACIYIYLSRRIEIEEKKCWERDEETRNDVHKSRNRSPSDARRKYMTGRAGGSGGI